MATTKTSAILSALFLFSLLAVPATKASARTPAAMVTVAPGVRLRVVEAGDAGGAPTIVLIPGFGAGADIWDDQIKRLSSRFKVVSFDPRSQGASTKIATGNTPEQRAADLHALLAAKHINSPVLVGWSQAAQDVAAYVTRYGTDGLSGIIFVDAAVSDGAKSIATRPQQAAAQFDRFAIYVAHQEDYLRGMFGFIISKPQPKGSIDHLVAEAMKTPPSIGIAELVADMFGNDLTPAFKKMNCPVLIIAAENSGELARQQAETKLIKGSRFSVVKDSSHAVFLDQPDEFATLLENFVGQLRLPKK